MNKVKIVLLMASMVLAVTFVFSCSSNNSPEWTVQSSGSEYTAQSSSSEGTAQSSSSEWTAQSSSSEEATQSSSSEGTAQSSSSEEIAQSSSSSNSSSSSGNTAFGTAGFWFLTTDEANDGTSTVGNAKDGDGNYIVLVQDGGNPVAKIQNYSLGRALYDAKMNQYPAYVDMSLNLKNNNEYKEILSCEDGFIYKYKGAAHIFRTKLSTVTDYNYHHTTVSASEDWKTAIIPISDLKQESSGASRPFDFGRLDSLSWYLRDGLSSKTGDLAVYNVKCAANCDGKAYDSETHKCEEGYIIGKNESICNGVAYDPEIQFCDGNNIVDKCGGNKYNPAMQFCENGIIKNGLKDSRDGKVYGIVQIGEQVWMAENLNYNASGSRCYSNLESNCDTYGRLYNWSTAMNFASSCNSSFCSSQIQTKHRGICPSGWHIPSDADWDVLATAVGGSSTAGTKLKAASGWNKNYGTNDYGFSALPGGGGYSDGSFHDVGDVGNWWRASESSEGYSDRAYGRFMGNINDLGWSGTYKSFLYSVRCLRD